MKSKCLLAFAFACVACGPQPIEPELSVASNTREDASYLFVPTMFQTREVKVCWDFGGWVTEKLWVRSSIETEFNQPNAYFAFRFVGFDSCVPGEAAVRITERNERPHAKYGTAAVSTSDPKVVLNFGFPFYDFARCSPTTSRETCIRVTAVHEFGHVAGLIHEQQRADTPTSCTAEFAREIETGGVAKGEWDTASAMNYCNATKNNDGHLSLGDQSGLGWLYPNSAEALINRDSLYGMAWQMRYVLTSLGCGDLDTCLPADVDHDGVLDTVGLNRVTKTARVVYGYREPWGTPKQWVETRIPYGTDLCGESDHCRLGDVDGDGKPDLVIFKRAPYGGVVVARNTGSAFVPSESYDGFCVDSAAVCQLADVNGDGLQDIVEFLRGGSGDVNIALRTRYFWPGSSWLAFAPKTLAHDWFCVGNESCAVGDLNGDRRADLIGFSKNGPVFVAFSTGTSFWGTGYVWHDWFCVGDETCRVGDFNGDGRADIMALRSDGFQFVAHNTGSRFAASVEVRNTAFCNRARTCRVADADGDGRDDLVAYAARGRSLGPKPDDPTPGEMLLWTDPPAAADWVY